ncbi:hypothetical protein D2T29_12760 [Sinirhodobacter populi]|uniref:Uncharacterized protein n=1 Tax=Paenirhodobacter populi TaxID=2306993 RepID=A0A443KCW3_9RHOB|nr:hypothetical protein [Sinirhodobacter populi]RWR30536.1 hypothetical protein D2T29_12760 [Sinirhodobacter populi]
MARFEISNKTSGHCFGVFEGVNADEVLNALCRYAGYIDFAASVLVTERPDRYETDDEWIDAERAELSVVEV